MMTAKAIASCTLLFLLTTNFIHAQGTKEGPPDPEASCKTFVQEFYDWYSAKAMDETKIQAAVDIALKNRSSQLSPELVRALKENAAAEAKGGGQTQAMDFDPFLNSQDIADRYVIGDIAQKDKTYWVEVYGIWSGRKRLRPDVVPELEFRHGQWIFVNFHYGQRKGEDLLNLLKSLRDDRREHSP
ncbi:MAG TPA: hypothetical protein VLY23_15070 [Candidatus Acidoferrum sp.]|nr:hypothetical protein [Candidatus Acidoferrum sp.]